MEHDDRTRAANLARLRKGHAPQTLGDQLSIFNPGTSATPLLDLAVQLAISLDKLLTLLDELPMPQATSDEIKDLRQNLGRDLSHFLELRSSTSLTIAMQDLRRHLGLART